MPDPAVTCPDCLKRLAEGKPAELRRRYKLGPSATVARPLAQGHAMYRHPAARALISICRAQPRQ